MCSQRCLIQHRFWYYRTQTCRFDIGSLIMILKVLRRLHCDRSFTLLRIVSDMFLKSGINLPFIRPIKYTCNPICLPTYLPNIVAMASAVNLYISLSLCISVCLYLSLAVVHVFPCISVFISLYPLSVCLSASLSIHRSI